MLNGGPFLLLSACLSFVFAWFILDCGLWFLLLRVFLLFVFVVFWLGAFLCCRIP